jgi:2-C-methyl-D-erythritol 4-phosphate cytidylyltransferase
MTAVDAPVARPAQSHPAADPPENQAPKEPLPMGRFAVILPAAGKSSRFGEPGRKKIFADLDGRAVWLRAAEPFVGRDDVAQTIVAVAAEDRELFERRYRPNVAFLNITVVEGGAERHDTIARALDAVDPACEFVAVHDAARPCVSADLIDAVFAAAREFGAALPGIAVADTLKRVDPATRRIVETVSRAELVAVQTPQAFRRDLLIRAYAARSEVPNATDDAQLVEALGHPVHVVDGSPFNLKITTAADLKVAAAFLQAMPKPKREGPAHPFADERTMW